MIRSMVHMSLMIALAAVFGVLAGVAASYVSSGAVPVLVALVVWFLSLVWMGGFVIGCLCKSLKEV